MVKMKHIFTLLFIIIFSANNAIGISSNTIEENINSDISNQNSIGALIDNFSSYVYNILSSDTITIPDVIIGLMGVFMLVFIGRDVKLFGDENDILIMGSMGLMVFFTILGTGAVNAFYRIILRLIMYVGTLAIIYIGFSVITLIAIATIKQKLWIRKKELVEKQIEYMKKH